jgi:hypothetical protein
MKDKDIIKHISENEDLNFLVSILELIKDSINIDTVSGMAEKENKTPRGIKISNQYRKVQIGRAKLVVKGLKDNNLPF